MAVHALGPFRLDTQAHLLLRDSAPTPGEDSLGLNAAEAGSSQLETSVNGRQPVTREG